MTTPLEALQNALAGEHAAVYVLGVVGGRVSASAQPDLWAEVDGAYEVHRTRRDRLTALVASMGAEPMAAEVAYELPNPAMSPHQLTETALVVEQRCAAVYADTVGSTSGAGRQWALEALEDAAVRQLTFGGAPEAFPGLAEL